jgi:hypothetical protein
VNSSRLGWRGLHHIHAFHLIHHDVPLNLLKENVVDEVKSVYVMKSAPPKSGAIHSTPSMAQVKQDPDRPYFKQDPDSKDIVLRDIEEEDQALSLRRRPGGPSAPTATEADGRAIRSDLLARSPDLTGRF